MPHLIGYNVREALPKELQKGNLQLCLGKHRLEWLLERCEAAYGGKGGGGSTEIETRISWHLRSGWMKWQGWWWLN